MLSIIEVRNNAGGLLTLPLQDPDNGYFVEDVEGLDPVKANIVSTSFAGQDGEQYQASQREKRNIILTLGVDAGYLAESVRALRKYLYQFFMPKADVSLRFYDDEIGAVDISGKVESFDFPLFTKDPTGAISILCMRPEFYVNTPTIFSQDTVADTTEIPLAYDGDIETGFDFEIDIDRDIDGFTIYNRRPDNNITIMDVEYAFLSGDVVKISTINNQKGVRLTRAGIESSILYSLSPTAPWINLWPGTNNIRVAVDGAGIPYTITYTTKYGGL